MPRYCFCCLSLKIWIYFTNEPPSMIENCSPGGGEADLQGASEVAARSVSNRSWWRPGGEQQLFGCLLFRLYFRTRLHWARGPRRQGARAARGPGGQGAPYQMVPAPRRIIGKSGGNVRTSSNAGQNRISNEHRVSIPGLEPPPCTR